jgi:hypothetical protein
MKWVMSAVLVIAIVLSVLYILWSDYMDSGEDVLDHGDSDDSSD